ncbi:tetratricopeptide repeat protein [Flavobacteriaceae bacterium TP-CH-4]|uniref:Tetratricopeptide repeat protein n=1 Tax=Pelagihabitans pacificus TaxID=2696054 RepID=A0A967ASS9_9FLAO|nr:tetratricopeptide repeat protein [Pelagihabitans pacificus]NHF58570.1 tetratricopeptide repeat protein [Pelagihabitans pacificus]
MLRTALVYTLLMSSLFTSAQAPLENGFTLLEKGRFEQAESFFGTYLRSDPDNKTAQICYGRAVGLSGEPQKATSLFAGLLKTYPDDFEIRINYNESFLWGGEYDKAKPLYAELVARYPENFGALLGYANTLGNLKEYTVALEWIEKALALQPGNESAKVSRKYIRLGYANTFVNKQDYPRGKEMLKEIFTDFPEDKDALLNLANVYLITKETDSAKAAYRRYATTPKDSITALNGIALAEHIGAHNREAQRVAESAKIKVRTFKDTELIERTYERHVQALIWNRKFGKARQQIDSLSVTHSGRNWVLALRATLGMYTGDFKTSLQSYDAILANDSTSFDGNLGKANALFASDRIVSAYKSAFQTLKVFPHQKDAMGLIEKMNARYAPMIGQQAGYTFDNGNNVVYFTNTTANIPWATRFRTTLSYQYRSTENTISTNKANSHILLAGFEYSPFPNTRLKTVVGLNNSRFMTEAYTQPVLDAKLVLKPYKLQNLELGYQREVQNFNADLIEREIVMNHYGINYNLGTNFNLGWYTQVMHTRQTDENSRNLLFTSLYYNLLHKPVLKAGVNYQYLSFEKQVPSIYFSPEEYQAYELFADFRGDLSKKTGFWTSVATGLQQVEEDPQTTIFRAEAGLRHQFGKRLSGNLYGKYSNIASATAAGFEFTELGVQLNWLLTKRPLFYGRVGK